MAEIKKKVEEIVEQYSQSRKYYQTYHDNWIKYYKKYRGWLDIDTQRDLYKWRSRLFIPALARAVDGLLPDLLLTLFTPVPFFNVLPREEKDVSQAKIMEALLSYQFQEANFFNQFGMFLQQMAIYGTSFGKVIWEKEEKEITRVVMEGLEKKKKKETELVFDGPRFETLDIFDVFVSPRATSLRDTWVLHRMERTLGELKELAKQNKYDNVDELEAYVGSLSKDGYQKEERKEAQGLPKAFSEEKGNRRRIEILEYWNEDRTRVVTIAAQKIILKDRENPYQTLDPFVCARLWPAPFELYGIGIAEKAGDLQDQLNSEVNQRLDNRTLRQNLIVKVRRGANVNIRNIVSRPGAIWLCDDTTAIEPVVVPDTSSSSSFAEESLLKQEIEEITGVSKYATGSGSDTGRRTATEVSVLTRMSSKGFALILKSIEEQALKPIIKKFYQLDGLLMDKTRVIRIVGEKGMEFKTVEPTEIAGDYDFIPAASSQLVDKGMKASQMIQFFQMAEGDPILRENLKKKIYELWGEKDYDEIRGSQFMAAPPPGGGQNTQGTPPSLPSLPPTGVRAPSPMEGMGQMGAMPMGQGGLRPPMRVG